MARKLEVEIVGDDRSYQAALKRSGDATEKVTSRFGGLAKAAVLGAGVAGVGALVVGLKSSVNAALEAEQSQTRLKAALAAANISYAKHGEAIDAAVQKTSHLAALDDEDLSDSFSKLVRTTGNVKESIEGMGLAADIARARNISLEAATKMVEKASLGQETAFKRVGVEVEKGATSTEILRAAQEKFAGAAKEYGDSAAGAQDRLGVAFENLQETVGAKVLPVLATLAETMVNVIGFVEAHWPQVSAVFDMVAGKIRAAWESNGRPVFESVKSIIRDVVTVCEALWRQFGGAITSIVERDFKTAYTLVKNGLEIIRSVFKLVTDLIHGDWSAAWNDLKNIVSKSLNSILTLVRGIVDNIFDAAKAIGSAFVKGISAGLSALGDALTRLIRVPINAIIDAWNSIGIPSFHVHIPIPFAPDINFDTPSIGLPDIPHMAEGGIAMGPTLALIGERGPEAVVPLGRGLGDVVVHSHVYLDGREIYQSVQRHAASDMKAGGSGVPGRDTRVR